jgi:uncharacterized protein YifN (PemK superfamily)
MNNTLAKDFVIEILAIGLHKKDFFSILLKYLKFNYLQTEAEKRLWQYITKQYRLTGIIPMRGQLQQHFGEEPSV